MDFGSFHIDGFSLGGIETWLRIPEWNLAIDVGRGPAPLVGTRHLALTHTHIDHAAGLPYLLSLRSLFGMRQPPTIFVPADAAAELEEMLAAWHRLGRGGCANYQLVAARPGERHRLGRDLELEPFETCHRVPSCGYTVIRSIDKLLAELAGTPGPELARMKQSGTPITERREVALLSVTGDTLPEVHERQPHILKSQVLVTECTFLDERKPYRKVRAGGHTHLDDLVERADAFENQHLVLSHFSQMYGRAEVEGLVGRLAERLKPELHVFPMEEGF